MAVAGEQPDAGAVTNDNQAITIMLYFVQPLRPGRNLGSARREARLNVARRAVLKKRPQHWVAGAVCLMCHAPRGESVTRDERGFGHFALRSSFFPRLPPGRPIARS